MRSDDGPGVAQRTQPLKLDAASVNRGQTAAAAVQTRGIQMPDERHRERRSPVRTQQRQKLWCALDLEVLGVGRLIAIYSWRLTKGRRRSSRESRQSCERERRRGEAGLRGAPGRGRERGEEEAD